ncbi:MAG: gpW family head-tail joining protein [Pseudomonadota bacterium]
MQITVTDENRAMWQHRLAQAEAALHDVLIGRSATALGYDGESVTYKPANLYQLRAYIAEMKKALSVSSQPVRARARSIAFGGGFH